jgi:hypothetical protein
MTIGSVVIQDMARGIKLCDLEFWSPILNSSKAKKSKMMKKDKYESF